MPATKDRSSAGNPAGQQMVQTLRAFHHPLRSDVASLRNALEELNAAVVDVDRTGELIQGLTTADLAWQLKSGCQWYCSALDGHHSIEDARMLPVMEREFPELRPRIKRLRRQHDDMLSLIQALAHASRNMTVDRPETITVARDLVTELAEMLQGHLDFEEETLFPYFLKMNRDWHRG